MCRPAAVATAGIRVAVGLQERAGLVRGLAKITGHYLVPTKGILL